MSQGIIMTIINYLNQWDGHLTWSEWVEAVGVFFLGGGGGGWGTSVSKFLSDVGRNNILKALMP